jgi:sulfopyruvate decarboxylase TPP-binding subunit
VDFDENVQKLVFTREAEDLGVTALARMAQAKVGPPLVLLQATA